MQAVYLHCWTSSNGPHMLNKSRRHRRADAEVLTDPLARGQVADLIEQFAVAGDLDEHVAAGRDPVAELMQQSVYVANMLENSQRHDAVEDALISVAAVRRRHARQIVGKLLRTHIRQDMADIIEPQAVRLRPDVVVLRLKWRSGHDIGVRESLGRPTQ
jgi:hypothetical protein